MEPPLPYATPALAKAVWEHQSSASARSVARALGAAGYPVHWVTVARWRRTGWQPIGPARRHPLALARAGLESVAPVVTGIPTTSIKNLIKEYPNRESLEKADRCRATPLGGTRGCHGRGDHRADNSGTSSIIREHQCGGLICSKRGNRSRCCWQRVRAGADA